PIGLAQALKRQQDSRKVFGILGDSTFFHSGMNSMIDAIHAQANVCLCVLDNSITAMTGHQENAGTERNLMGEEVPRIELLDIIKATGLSEEFISVVDPLDLNGMKEAIEKALAVEGPYLIVTKRPCALIKSVIKQNAGKHCVIDADKCKGCKSCMKIACPS